MKSRAIWISYDLGIKGDFPGLYSWLDNHDAKESGNSIAFIEYFYKKNLLEEIGIDLKQNVEFKQGDRIYIVRTRIVDSKTKVSGRFIIGKRKSNPWEGYGQKGDDVIDGDE